MALGSGGGWQHQGEAGIIPGLDVTLVTQALSHNIGSFFCQGNDRVGFVLSYHYHGNHSSTHRGRWEKAKLGQHGRQDPGVGGIRI